MIRKLAAAVAAALALAALPLSAAAQAWPRGTTLTVVVPLAAGDGGDITARAMSEALSR